MNNRSPYATANSIRMKQIRHKGTFLVVEGDADARFYKMFVNLEQCRVVPANSKGAVIKVLETIADEHSGVLGIVDADYWNVDHIQIAVGDGALGFWKAISQVFPSTKWQRCWVHKTANVLNKMPKKSQSKAKGKIHDIWMAETKEEAEKAFDLFVKTYSAKYDKATKCLLRDREVLLTFYDFPAEHWKHLRTTNPIESTFATVRLRTAKVRGCFSVSSVTSMAWQLALSAEKTWRKLSAPERAEEVAKGIRFENGERLETIAA